MPTVGDKIDLPSNYKPIGLSTGTLTPEWREVLEDMVELINSLSDEVKTLKEAQDNG